MVVHVLLAVLIFGVLITIDKPKQSTINHSKQVMCGEQLQEVDHLAINLQSGPIMCSFMPCYRVTVNGTLWA